MASISSWTIDPVDSSMANNGNVTQWKFLENMALGMSYTIHYANENIQQITVHRRQGE